MAENIKLAEFDIDIDAVVKSASELKKSIDEIKKAQQEARKENKADTTQYVENEANLKALNAEYRKHIKVLSDNITATADSANRTELLNAALNEEVVSISQAREQNKLLNKLRNEANLATDEGRKELELLNKALDINNEFIKENVDELSQQKINVGNYTDSVKEALNEMNPFNQSITVFISNINEAGGVMPFLQNGLKGVTAGIKGATKASLTFLATPIGAVIGAIGLALGLVVNALGSTQEGMDKVTAVTRPLMAVLEVLFGVIQDMGLALIDAFSNPLDSIEKVYNYVKDKVIKQFNALYDIAAGLATLDFDRAGKGLEDLGNNVADVFDDAASAAGKIGDEIQRGIDLGKELDRLTKEYERTQIRNAELLPLLNAQLREQNKIAEDTTKSQAEREKAAEKTLELSKQINAAKKEELTLELAIAENEAARNDTSREDELAIAEIKGKINDADAAAAKQQTTQQNKLNTIRKDAAAAAQKAVDAQIAKQKELLDLYIAEQGDRARTLQEELTLAEQISEQRKAILKEELKAKKLSEEAYMTELLNLDTELARKRAELSVDNAMREVEANKMSLALQRENAQFLSNELAEQRKQENNTILLQEQELAKLRLENGLINQQEFDEAIRELSETNRIANKEIDDEREAIEKQEKAELRAIEFEEELLRLQEEGATKFEIQQAQLDEQRELELQKLAEQREQGLISEELHQARLNKINADYKRGRANFELQNEKALAEQRINLAQNLFSALGGIVDKNSAFGKALAVSQALINTYKGITAALAAPFPSSIPALVTATVTGFKAVKDIISTKVPKAEGGSISSAGSSSISGSSPASDLQSLASNQSNLTQIAASGNTAVQNQINQNAETSGLANNVAQAVREGAEAGTAKGSEQGMTNLSDNKQIENLSSF